MMSKNIETVVGQNIARRLRELNRTPSWLGREVGVTQAIAGRWAAGKNAPNSKHLPAICAALEINMEYLFERGMK